MVIIGIGAHRQSGDEYYSMYSLKSVVEAMLRHRFGTSHPEGG